MPGGGVEKGERSHRAPRPRSVPVADRPRSSISPGAGGRGGAPLSSTGGATGGQAPILLRRRSPLPMRILRIAVRLLPPSLALVAVGCASVTGGRTGVAPQVRTITSVGDRPLPVV